MSSPAIVGAYAIGFALLWFWARLSRTARGRALAYLCGSYLFYASLDFRSLPILVFSSLTNYALGRFLRRQLTLGRLSLGILFNLALLSSFKYLPLVGGFASAQRIAPWLSNILLPLGISFWTFQAISYLLDLYREEEVDPSLLEFAVYMAFWPTVISGPICRLSEMLPQFRQPMVVTWDRAGRGAQRILMGLVMMTLSQFIGTGIAPGQGVDAGFGLAAIRLGGLDVWFLAVGYGFQLFFNFAGYSHIVIGAAELFGVRLRENFNRPYLAATPSEFWTRWHMSLSFWIRDYVFFPLATVRTGTWWRNLSLVISMFLFGLWHKGSYLFVLWGLYHGTLLVLHRQWQQFGARWTNNPLMGLLTRLSTACTFAAVSLGWIFFRAESNGQAATMFRTVLSPNRYRLLALSSNFYGLILITVIGYFGVIGVTAWLDRRARSPIAVMPDRGVLPVTFDRAILVLARDRWVWVVPIAVVISMYALLTIRIQGSLVGPMMYQVF